MIALDWLASGAKSFWCMAGIGLGLSLIPGHAYSYDLSKCMEGPPNARIAECTRAVEESAAAPQDLGIALYLLGRAYQDSGDLDRAIADYTQSIKLAPAQFVLVKGYTQRGFAYRAKGEREPTTVA